MPVFLQLLLAGCAEDAPPPVVLETTDSPTLLLSTAFAPDGDDPFRDQLAKHRHTALEDGALRVNYVGYERGSERVTAQVPLPAAGETMTLCYDVCFPKGFDFGKGGKLHGLGPAKPITGGAEMTQEGWSARVTFTSGGGIATYLYQQGKSKKFGITKSAKSFRFEPDQCHAVTLQVTLNTPGKSNGSVRLYVDGEPLVAVEKVPFRGVGGEASKITKFLFSTFHGGQSEGYAPRDDEGNFATEHAHFDNLAIHAGIVVRPAPLDR